MGLMGGVGLAGIGMYGAHAYGASPMMGYGYLDHSMAGHNPFAVRIFAKWERGRGMALCELSFCPRMVACTISGRVACALLL